jgi:hypothetical protein
MTIWVVTCHYEHQEGYFDSAWSTEEKAKYRVNVIEKRFIVKPDWTEISKAEIDTL